MPNVSLLTSGIGDVNLGGQLVPTGTVFAFAGSTAPSGWLLCDGTAYSQTTYSALFAVLGSTYNTQINPTTNAAYAAPTAGTFRVPDYRGIFLRSSGQASGQAAVSVGGHQGHATAPNGLSVQNTDLTHSHTINSAGSHSHTTPGGVQGGSGGFTKADTASQGGPSTNSAGDHSHSMNNALGNHNHGLTGDSETRPINKGVLYIIKV